MDKRLIGVLALVVGSAAGCATSLAAWTVRGTVFSTSSGSRAIVSGPTSLHAYAGDSGGEIHLAATRTGTDADCLRSVAGDTAVPLAPDRMVFVTVPAGEVACLRTAHNRTYELLWHARAQEPAPQLMASAIGPQAR